jgi:hypothetical protein
MARPNQTLARISFPGLLYSGHRLGRCTWLGDSPEVAVSATLREFPDAIVVCVTTAQPYWTGPSAKGYLPGGIG